MPQMKTKNLKSRLARKLFVSTMLCLNILGAYGTALAASDSANFSVGTYLTTEKQAAFESVPAYIVRFINLLSMVIGSFAFLAIVIGGFMMLTSGGREGSITKGKDIIKYAILGLVVALAAFFITSFVQSIFYEYTPPK